MRGTALALMAAATTATVSYAKHKDPLSNLAGMSRLNSTDKSLWLVSDQVEPGTILRTKPASFASESGAYFAPEEPLLEKAVHLMPNAPKVSKETIEIDNGFDLAALIPFLSGISPSFSRKHHISITGTDEAISEAYRSSVNQALLDFDKHNPDPSVEKHRADLIYRVNKAADLAQGDPNKTQYWIVLKVTRASTATWVEQKKSGAAVGAGCLNLAALASQVVDALPTGTAKPEAPAAASDASKPAAPAADPATSKSTPDVLFSVGPDGKVSGSVSSGSSKSSGSGQNTTSKPSDPTSGCKLGKVAFSSGTGTETVLKDAILFAQVVPIVKNKAGRLYIEGGDDTPAPAPKVVRRS